MFFSHNLLMCNFFNESKNVLKSRDFHCQPVLKQDYESSWHATMFLPTQWSRKFQIQVLCNVNKPTNKHIIDPFEMFAFQMSNNLYFFAFSFIQDAWKFNKLP